MIIDAIKNNSDIATLCNMVMDNMDSIGDVQTDVAENMTQITDFVLDIATLMESAEEIGGVVVLNESYFFVNTDGI